MPGRPNARPANHTTTSISSALGNPSYQLLCIKLLLLLLEVGVIAALIMLGVLGKKICATPSPGQFNSSEAMDPDLASRDNSSTTNNSRSVTNSIPSVISISSSFFPNKSCQNISAAYIATMTLFPLIILMYGFVEFLPRYGFVKCPSRRSTHANEATSLSENRNHANSEHNESPDADSIADESPDANGNQIPAIPLATSSTTEPEPQTSSSKQNITPK